MGLVGSHGGWRRCRERQRSLHVVEDSSRSLSAPGQVEEEVMSHLHFAVRVLDTGDLSRRSPDRSSRVMLTARARGRRRRSSITICIGGERKYGAIFFDCISPSLHFARRIHPRCYSTVIPGTLHMHMHNALHARLGSSLRG
jgi:hypothetical protein